MWHHVANFKYICSGACLVFGSFWILGYWVKDTVPAVESLTVMLILVLGTFKTHIHTNWGDQTLLLMDTGNFFLGYTVGCAKIYHLLSTAAEIHNALSFTCMPPLCLRLCSDLQHCTNEKMVLYFVCFLDTKTYVYVVYSYWIKSLALW
jgi:hypothetical protein